MKILFRVDADQTSGTGHWMRCFALAEALKESGGEPIFASCEIPSVFSEHLRSKGIEEIRLRTPKGSLEDARATAELASRAGTDWIVLDGYYFDFAYQRVIREQGAKMLMIDDYGHAEHYSADIVLNQNLYASVEFYPKIERGTRLLLGSRYVLFRSEFREAAAELPPIKEKAKKILVTLGGSDPSNATLKVAKALCGCSIDGMEVVVIIGAANPGCAEIEDVLRGAGFPFKLLSNVSNISEWMKWADIAIAAAGTTSYEMALMGLPAILLVLADNQKRVADAMSRNRVAEFLGEDRYVSEEQISKEVRLLASDFQRRSSMSEEGHRFIDTKGVWRVLGEMQTRLSLRNANSDDCVDIWKLANDPDLRKMSFYSEGFTLEQHRSWFQSKIVDPRSRIYLAHENSGKLVGFVRIDPKDDARSVISLTLAKEFRNKGYGTEMLRLGCSKAFHDLNIGQIEAYVLEMNERSHKVFREVGFREVEKTALCGKNAVRYVLEAK